MSLDDGDAVYEAEDAVSVAPDTGDDSQGAAYSAQIGGDGADGADAASSSSATDSVVSSVGDTIGSLGHAIVHGAEAAGDFGDAALHQVEAAGEALKGDRQAMTDAFDQAGTDATHARKELRQMEDDLGI
jgi:hypothetical protein